jgi:hypothetical protein
MNTLLQLPPVESSPIIFLRFASTSKVIAQLVRLRLEEEGIIVTEEKDPDSDAILLGLTVHQSKLEKEAERCRLFKSFTLVGMPGSLKGFEGSTILKPFGILHRECFQRKATEFSNEGGVAYDDVGLFTSADRVKIIYWTIESLPILKPGRKSSELVQELNKSIKIPVEDLETEYLNMYLGDALRNHGFVDSFAPVHKSQISERICKEAMDPRSPFPIEGIRSYYGEEIAFYFSWLQFYTRFLLFP